MLDFVTVFPLSSNSSVKGYTRLTGCPSFILLTLLHFSIAIMKDFGTNPGDSVILNLD